MQNKSKELNKLHDSFALTVDNLSSTIFQIQNLLGDTNNIVSIQSLLLLSLNFNNINP